MSTESNPETESKENNFETSLNPLPFPPPRTPLNSIPDPSQYHHPNDSDFDFKDKLEPARARRLSEKKLNNSLDRASSLGSIYMTSRISHRHGKTNSETSSSQSTPARSVSRASIGGAGGCNGGQRSLQTSRGKELYGCGVSKGMFVENSGSVEEVSHFELREDPSFWKDHNVQVLIRIRPLNTTERFSQGHDRCLKQESAHTLVWLGHPETRFTFDHVACESISQENLFGVAGLPMVENCLSGYNSCMFAYGQTGSGKTYTMMGEINQVNDMLCEDCGITPRIFEYLFSRIRMEEEKRTNENLKFTCKCSFLEIYNEQITDLLKPSSANLQLREDLNKGVYVENLSEYDVMTVDNVIKLLLQGAANRKMAATHMNRESSRSHSVFTCIIESRWESDSVKHFRFARLNLVDLAGSERQKSSGAEGDRLKEAANINKSLSTLGLVIMTLVDLAHGKQRHIPYRDSRLTFLLQDSLGGNSKTTIIANVSPSICSSHETLSTLKFAQRAKLIQNNAKVNEDASGDVTSLQREILKLKDQLSFLMNHPNLGRSPSILMPNSEEYRLADRSGISDSLAGERETNDLDIQCVENHEIIRLEAILEGAMRREKMANDMLKKLETEMEHLKEFACQREEDLRNIKMLLRFREEKIKQLELLVAGSLPTDHYLVGENIALKEEIQLLQAKMERNPDLTHFALENMRLHEQLQMFQKYYEQGEREIMMAEISQLREQLLEILERKTEFCKPYANQDVNTMKELEACKYMNSKLMRDIEELQGELRKLYSSHSPTSYDTMQNSYFKDTEEMRHLDKYSLVESASNNSEYGEVMSSYTQHNILEEISAMPPHPTDRVLQEKLDKLSKELEKAQALNCKYQEDQVAQMSHKQEVEFVCEQVEIETSRTILQLQEEVTALQLELNEKLSCLTQQNMILKETIAIKEEELNSVCHKWERATLELTNFLIEGSRNLKGVSSQLGSIVSSFPLTDFQIDQHVERAAAVCIEKEETILQLEKSLEDAQKLIVEMEVKLNSLREATIALNEYPEFDDHERKKVTTRINGLFNEQSNAVAMLENKMKCKKDHIIETNKRFYASLLTLRWLLDHGDLARNNNRKFVPSEEFGTHEASEVVIDDERSHASAFLSKCEEVHATIKEADYLLNELIKVNENAKQSNAMWRHRYQELMAENSCLVEENEQLKSFVHIKDEENKLLLEEIQSHLTAAVDSFSLLEGGFQQLQRDTEQKYKVLHSDVLALGREMHHFICSSRSLLQDVSSEVIETGLSFSVLCQCLMAKVIHEVPNFDRVLQGQLSLIRQQQGHEVLCLNRDSQCQFSLIRQHQGHAMKNPSEVGLSSEDDLITAVKGIDEGDANKFAAYLDTVSPDLLHDNIAYENMSLKQDLARKETLLKGLLFDFSLLQETASTRKDIKDETEKLIMILSEIRLEVEMKTSQLDNLLVQNRRIHGHLCATEKALDVTKSDLKHAQEMIETLSDKNAELSVLLEDMCLRKSEIEEQLEEQKEVIKGLENEIAHMTSSADRELVSVIGCLQEELQKVTNEKNHLSDEIISLNDKLEMVYALADENEALAVEARQGMEASKLYAEQKEEEVKILEHSIEELESTIHVLEKKVNEMDEELERHQSIRESLEIELQALRQRLSTVENIADVIESGSRDSMQDDLQLQGRLLELHEAHNEIKLLEKDISEKDKEIKQYKAYISELVLHSEAQSSQYQEKYKNLETMVQEERQNARNSVSAATPFSRSDKSSVRARGSSSPFRCIANFVQQTNLEKDHELSTARLQIGELEAMLANRQKEVCTLNTRLAAAESMTHDVIRDLLGVKLDMTNLANLIDQHQVQRLVEEAHRQTEEFLAKEQEILNLRKEIKDLIEEKESFMSEASAKAADLLAAQVTVEQLHERDQLLSAQNEMLKADKTNLLIRVAELDQMVKSLLRTQAQQSASNIKEVRLSRIGDVATTKGRRYSQGLLPQANHELPQSPRSNGNFQQGKINGHDTELRRMKHKS